MPTSAISLAGAAFRGVRLALPLQVGSRTDVVALEPAHCEWLARITAYVAVRNGLLGFPEGVTARLLPGKVRERHGDVRCLDSCVVELRDARDRQVSRMEFGRDVFNPFVAARVIHLVVEAGDDEAVRRFAFSLHASEDGDEPLPVAVPALPPLSIDALAAAATAVGTPGRDWVATFVHPAVVDAFALLEDTSRERGVEATGRIHTRVGFDPKRRAFVRVLERLVVTSGTVATGSTIVSPSASWGEFLATVPEDGPSVATSVHTHLHLASDDQRAGTSETSLGAQAAPLISVADRVTHLTAFTDPLAAGVILSLYPDRRVVKLYGYTPRATFEEEPGYWVRRRNR